MGTYKSLVGPPVGMYSPRFTIVESQPRGHIKLDSVSASQNPKILARDAARSLLGSESKRSLSQALQAGGDISMLPQLKHLRNETIIPAPVSEIISKHVPNVYFSKFSHRRGDLFMANMNDDSNIDYDNIFPEILSKNKKLAVNVNLERMPIRNSDPAAAVSGSLKSISPKPSYEVRYNLIDKRILVPNLAGGASGQISKLRLPSLIPTGLSSPRNEDQEVRYQSHTLMGQLANMEKLSMKKKINRLEGIIAAQGEFKARLRPDGRLMKDGLAAED